MRFFKMIKFPLNKSENEKLMNNSSTQISNMMFSLLVSTYSFMKSSNCLNTFRRCVTIENF